MSFIQKYIAVATLATLAFAVPAIHAGGSGRKVKAAEAPRSTEIFTISADLESATALPGNSEPASGDVTGTYDARTHILKFNARFLSLSGAATNARFHGPAAIDRTGWATVAAPRPESRLVTGTAWLDNEEEHDLLAGRWYFNVTTAKHPQGEIRGMVHVTPAAPQS